MSCIHHHSVTQNHFTPPPQFSCALLPTLGNHWSVIHLYFLLFIYYFVFVFSWRYSSFSFLKILFWSIVGLQCCVSFRCTIKWTSYTHTQTHTHVNICAMPCSVAQSHLTLCNPMDCSPPDSFVHGISRGRMLEWVVILSRGSYRPRDWTCISLISCIGRRILYHLRSYIHTPFRFFFPCRSLQSVE